MTISPPGNDDLLRQLAGWLDALEGEHFEFKEAKADFDFEKLKRYCCALANEGGGRVLLGVTNDRPRRVVGSTAFPQIERTRSGLIEKLPLRIEVFTIEHPDGRVVVIEIPSRPIGVPMSVDGRYWSRTGDSLVPLSEGRLRGIFDEAGRDFSATICPDATLAHLDPVAIDDFRRRWIDKSKNQALARLPREQILRDAELLVDDGVTYGALVLFGTRQAMSRFLAQAEVVFEYRSSEAAGPAQQRKEYRQGFFSFYDDLWTTVNLRNDVQHFQDGLFVLDIPTFAERPVREALLNAVSHRNYQLGGSVFLRQYPRRLVVESPGGFPVGVTSENVLDRQSPRNRRIAEAFQRCGLVERSGQGMDLIFEQSIREGKGRPDFRATDEHQVVITLRGEVTDPRFVQFFERVVKQTGEVSNPHDFLLLDLIHRDAAVPDELKDRLKRFEEMGIVERVGRGRGVRYLLSRRFYTMVGSRGAYTRRRGLDDETNKELLMKHLRENSAGSPLSELQQVLPHVSRSKVQGLLHELLGEGRVSLEGLRRWARWRPAKTGKGLESV